MSLNKKKRYNKQFLDPEYSELNVCPRTQRRWKQRGIEAVNDEENGAALLEPELVDIGNHAENVTHDAISPSTSLMYSSPLHFQDASTESDEEFELTKDVDGIIKSSNNIFNVDEHVTQQTSSHTDTNFFSKQEIDGNLKSSMFGHFTVFDVLMMVLAFTLRFSLSYKARSALIDMLKLLAGPKFESFDISNYKYSKYFDPPDTVISYNFFCSSCDTILFGPVSKNNFQTNTRVHCTSCEKDYNLTMNSTNYFISIDIEYQIRTYFDSQLLKHIIQKNISHDDSDIPNIMNDVQHGQLYQDMKRVSQFDLTYNFSTDGAPIFKSSKSSVWPLQMIINELPIEIRFKRIMLAGFLITKKEPTPNLMNLYIAAFANQAKKLFRDGISITSSTNNDVIVIKFAPLCASVDSVARPILQNRLQFNGYMGCSWCYANGQFLAGSMRYPMEEKDPPLRTCTSHLNDMNQALKYNKKIRGVKGRTALLQLPCFDVIWGMPVESMHGIYLGVVRQLWDIWTKPGNKFSLTASNRLNINNRLSTICPPHEIHRLPRPLQDKAHWKASEWRSWLLYYSLPCLKDILDGDAFKHFSLLVRSVYLLLQTEITTEHLNSCEYDLIQFVGEMNILYGSEAMTFNVHSLLHLVHSVKNTGPLWATSAFPYESEIFFLKNQVNGPKGVSQQIVRRHLQINALHSAVPKSTQNELCIQYCKNLYTYEPLTSNFERCGEVVLLGCSKICDSGEKIYSRCIYKGSVFHSVAYNRSEKSNNTMVLLNSGVIGQIKKIILSPDNTCHMLISLFTKTVFDHQLITQPHIFQIYRNFESVVVSVSELSKKCVFVKVENNCYACLFPNNCEIQ